MNSNNELFYFFLLKFELLLYEFFRYNIKWYIIPIQIQKMILFLLQKNVTKLLLQKTTVIMQDVIQLHLQVR